MPTLTVTITGLCAYLRRPNDAHVDVLFANSEFEHERSGHGTHESGHTSHRADPHIPMLWVPAADYALIPGGKGPTPVTLLSIDRQLGFEAFTPQLVTSDQVDSGKPAHAGLPIFLAGFESGLIQVDRSTLASPVTVIESKSPLPKVPQSDEDWQWFNWVPDLNELYPQSNVAPNVAEPSSGRTHFVLRLNGGRLAGSPPSKNAGRNPWRWEVAERPAFTRVMTDVVKFQIQHRAESLWIVLKGRPSINDFVVPLRTDRDTEAVFVHEPAVVRVEPPRANESGEVTLGHLPMLASAVFDTAPARHPSVTKAPEACPLIPDCPGGQVRA